MDTESPVRTSPRTRPLLFVLLAVLVGAFLYWQLGGSAGPPPSSSNPQRRPTGAAQKGAPVDPAELDVKLETLEAEKPTPGGSERNPFRFAVRPPPPDPNVPPPAQPPEPPVFDPRTPPRETPLPPIPLKFIGILDSAQTGVVALLTDCKTRYQAKEGTIVAGQYRLVKIGLESVVMEYLDGKGQTTLRVGAGGQECVGR